MFRFISSRRPITSVILGLVFVLHTQTGYADEQQQARQILDATGVQGGLIVHLGCGDGKLTAALRTTESHVVQGLDTDEENVAGAREHIRKLGLYGPVSVARFNGERLPYADNLANLIVVSGVGVQVSGDEVARVLAPGGVALLKHGVEIPDTRNLTPETSSSPPGWTKFTSPRPDTIDDWTHWLHAADGNPVSSDTVVDLPRRVQWFAKPTWSRSHEKSPSLTGMVSARGRVFYICDEGPASIGGPVPDKWRLVARDAFNGVLLWKRPVPDWGWQAWSPKQPMNLRWGNPRFIHRRLVAVEDRVYVTLGYSAPVTAMDAATGKTIRVYEDTENTSEILYHDGLLVFSVATELKTEIKNAPPLKVLAIDPSSGKQLWEAGPFPSLYDLGERGKSNVLKQGRLMIAAGGDHVYCVTEKEILALGLDDGRAAWTVVRPPAVLPRGDSKKVSAAAKKMFTNLGSVMYHDGRVYFAQPYVPTGKLVNSSRMTLVCLSAETGEEEWRKICADWSYTTNLNVYAIRGMIWAHADAKEGQYDFLGLDPATGEVKIKHNLASILTTRHHHRCYRNRATEKFLLVGKEGVEYVNLEDGAIHPHRWLRGMCLYGVMPANGLLYVPPQACSCNPMTMLQGYWALAAAGKSKSRTVEESKSEQGAEDRLERGPAYGQIDNRKSAIENPHDWPMYRRDPLRSGATDTTVPARLRERWQTTIGGRLTGPVAAGGRVYLGSRDTHEVVALDATDGTVVWRYGMRGDMDTPPTVYQGMVLAGCSDGWVYCLRVSDGSLIWRFRAAPLERYVVAEDRLESAWPVHGSVLILNDIAYVTAGRSSFLDGGIRFYMLRPRTGEVLNEKEKTLFTEQTDQEAFYEGVTSDLLASDGDALFMRHLHMDPKTLELTRLGWWGFTGPEAKGRDYPYLERHGLPVSDKRYTYLRSGQGFLDDSLYGRTQFHLDGGEACHLLCFNRQRSYGFQMSTHAGHFVFFTPGDKGYSILGFDRERSTEKKIKALWQQKLPLRARAMVLAGENLFVSGVPDRIVPDDPLASFEGRLGAELHALSASDGTTLSKTPLDSPPVFDGLIAAGRQLFMTTQDGRVMCMGIEKRNKEL
ncbi:MAG: PQQ-binding-like beta-propeller repeat protein [Planctomycetes bacterium]|nr:PQQ-binding-like beta-propeller repeat protein [Planctomycetota bacterium]